MRHAAQSVDDDDDDDEGELHRAARGFSNCSRADLEAARHSANSRRCLRVTDEVDSEGLLSLFVVLFSDYYIVNFVKDIGIALCSECDTHL